MLLIIKRLYLKSNLCFEVYKSSPWGKDSVGSDGTDVAIYGLDKKYLPKLCFISENERNLIVPENEVGQEIPGAPVSGTWTLELCSQADSIFPSPAEMEEQIGSDPVRGSEFHTSYFTKLSRKVWLHVITFILKIWKKIPLRSSSDLCLFMWADCGLRFSQRKAHEIIISICQESSVFRGLRA